MQLNYNEVKMILDLIRKEIEQTEDRIILNGDIMDIDFQSAHVEFLKSICTKVKKYQTNKEKRIERIKFKRRKVGL